jgi:hypothetical protein
MRVTPYHLLPTTEIFIAQVGGVVVATMTLVKDGQLGLPLESVYPAEVARKRELGLSVGEVSCLADRLSSPRRFFPVFCELNRYMVQYARRENLDQILVAVHPKHARFYQRYMCFEPIGGLAAYPSVRNRPAVALCMDFSYIDEKGLENPERHARFFGQPIPDVQLAPQPMSAEERSYFQPMLEASFNSAHEKRRARLPPADLPALLGCSSPSLVG